MFIALFLSAYNDFFDVCADKWYLTFADESDALIYGQILNQNDGHMDNSEHFLGKYMNPDDSGDDLTYNIYAFSKNEYPVDKEYYVYTGNLGVQGTFYSLIYKVFKSLSPVAIIRLFTLATALLYAIVMFILVYWVSDEFGLIIGVITTVSIVSMPWLTLLF